MVPSCLPCLDHIHRLQRGKHLVPEADTISACDFFPFRSLGPRSLEARKTQKPQVARAMEPVHYSPVLGWGSGAPLNTLGLL